MKHQKCISDKPLDEISTSEEVTFLEYYKVSIPWLKSLIWPLIAFILILMFRKPLVVSSNNFAENLEKATQLQYKSINVYFEEEIASKATHDVQTALSDISDKALSTLIRQGHPPNSKYANIGHITSGCPQSKEEIFEEDPSLRELEDRGLIELSAYNYQDCVDSYQWKWTALGNRTHQVFMDILTTEISKALEAEN